MSGSKSSEPKPLSFSEQEFLDSLRSDGFLSALVDEARPHFVHLHNDWFDHARALNHEGLRVLERREAVVVGRSTHHPHALSTRLVMRALNSFQASIILYERGLSAEGDTLARGIYEIAFWLGFFLKDTKSAVECFRNEEIRSQLGRSRFYMRQLDNGEIELPEGIRAEFKENHLRLKTAYDNSKRVDLEKVARRVGLVEYYDAHKHLSASSAHASLNSIHRYLKPREDEGYDGHVWGPDTDTLDENVSLSCVGIGICLALFGSMIPVEEDETKLESLLQKTDTLRAAEKDQGKHVATLP